MSTMTEKYLALLEKWFPSAGAELSSVPGTDDMITYGTGFEGWGVQTQQKAFAAYAIYGHLMKPDDKVAGKTKGEMLAVAIKMLRFSLASHIEGHATCMDGTKWGHTWISVLGIERMMAGVDTIYPLLDEYDRSLLKKVLLSEADWLLKEYTIVASPDDPAYNKPESNLWNGAFLYRTAIMYPICQNAAGYREKGTSFLLNSISVPSDKNRAEQIDGRKISEWHIGANFQETYALVHHGYMNVGYMVICLSQIAMLHFSCRERGIEAPEALYHHALNLWKLVKHFTFPDGRLLRIGGDTRVRYCYCQDYAISVWLFIADKYGDLDCLEFEKKWFETVRKEQEVNGDGSFTSTRLAQLKEISPLYYTRLESDRAATLAQAALWHDKFATLDHRPEAFQKNAEDFQWYDPFHGALVLRNAANVRSWVWMAAKCPFGLCLPLDDSSLAEWDFNCSGQIKGTGANSPFKLCSHHETVFENGFVTMGKFEVISASQVGEGQKDDVVAETQIVCAALPDNASVLYMQYSKAPKRVYVKSVKGLMLTIPNDIFNNGSRQFILPHEKRTFNSLQAPFGPLELHSRMLNIDGKINVELFYGADSLTLNRPASRQIEIRYKRDGGGNLYAEEICSKCFSGLIKFEPGELLLDECFAVQSGKLPSKSNFADIDIETISEACRFAAFRGSDDKIYALAANFGDKDGFIKFNKSILLSENGKTSLETKILLQAGSCCLKLLCGM